MLKSNRLAAALGLMTGVFALGGVQAEEQGLRPLPEDVATQADEMTEETMPFPKGSLQGAPDVSAPPVQDADLEGDEDDLADESGEDMNEDFSSTAKSTGPLASAETLASRFAHGDTDRSGALSAAELEALDDDALVFADLDLDADGAVTRAEWNAQLQQRAASTDDDE